MTSRDIRVYSLTILILLLTALLVLANADKIDSIPQPQTITPTEQIEPSRGDFVRAIECEATAYCLQGTTFTGLPAGMGVVAVDPEVIPLGSYLYIEGYGQAQALDTGRDIIGRRVDIWLPTRDDCLKYGRKQVEVKILREGDYD